MNKRRHSSIIAALFVVLALLLSGCGGGMMAAVVEAEGGDDDSSSGACMENPGGGTISGSENLERAFNYLVSAGYSKEMAAGIAGNLQSESAGANPGLAEYGYASQWGWGVPDSRLRGWGIVQWTWGRHAKVRDYVVEKLGREFYVSQYSNPTAETFLAQGDNESKLLQAQLEYLLKEMQDPYYKPNVYDPMMQSSSPEAASEIFLRKFEIPAGVEAQVPIRAKQARAIYDKYGSNSPSKPDTNTDDDGGSSSSGSASWSWVTEPGFTITSPYGMRVHPITGVNKLHDGLDIARRPGGNLMALTDGKVEVASMQGGWGNRVVLRLGDGTAIAYNHMASLAVSVGQTVKGGDVLGVMGTTGMSTGVHLHFNVYKPNGPLTADNTVDPKQWLATVGFDANTGKSNGTNPDLGNVDGGGECDTGGGNGGSFPEKGDPNDPSAKKLTPETLRLLTVIRNEFPEVKDIGGWRSGSVSGAPDHPNGEALDIMTYKDQELAKRIAQFIMDNADELKIDYQITIQRIWNPPGGQNGGSDAPGAWRPMEDRGDPTQNHMDHVHVTTINN